MDVVHLGECLPSLLETLGLDPWHYLDREGWHMSKVYKIQV